MSTRSLGGYILHASSVCKGEMCTENIFCHKLSTASCWPFCMGWKHYENTIRNISVPCFSSGSEKYKVRWKQCIKQKEFRLPIAGAWFGFGVGEMCRSAADLPIKMSGVLHVRALCRFALQPSSGSLGSGSSQEDAPAYPRAGCPLLQLLQGCPSSTWQSSASPHPPFPGHILHQTPSDQWVFAMQTPSSGTRFWIHTQSCFWAHCLWFRRQQLPLG